MRLRLLVLLALVVGSLAGVPAGLRLAGPERVAATGSLALPVAGAAQVSGTWEPAPAPKPPTFTAADAVGPTVALYSSPDVPLAGVEPLTNPTWEGLPLVFRVLERRDGWLRVQVSRRPNGFQAWIRASDVALREVPNRVKVELAARRVTVLDGEGTPLFATTVAVGRETTPTPVGHFFVDGVVLLEDRGGPYGAAQISVSAFSEVYTSFGGGIGQMALHGTNAPGLLGQAVSNGCVRLDNDSVLKVLSLAPPGTPVEIVA